MRVLSASCRDPSSPRQTGGPRGQQLGGDGPLAASGFVRSLCCQQLRCGVQTGRCVCVWKQMHYSVLKCGLTKDVTLLSPSDSLLWQQVASSREECVQIDTLIPGGHYQFRVRASNRWGLGPPSEPSNMVTLSSTSKSEFSNVTVNSLPYRQHP